MARNYLSAREIQLALYNLRYIFVVRFYVVFELSS